MGKSVNKVMLLGNVGKDPETRAMTTGTILTTLSLATSERYKQGDEWKDRTEWHNVKCYGRLGEIARDYVRRGSKLYVEGRIQTDSWDDKETGQKRYRTSVIAFDISLLDGRDNRQSQTADDGYGTHSTPPNPPAVDDSDIPF